MEAWLAQNQAAWLLAPRTPVTFHCAAVIHLRIFAFLVLRREAWLFHGSGAWRFIIVGRNSRCMNKCLEDSLLCVCFPDSFWDVFKWGFVLGPHGCHLRTIIMNICKTEPSLSRDVFQGKRIRKLSFIVSCQNRLSFECKISFQQMSKYLIVPSEQ